MRPGSAQHAELSVRHGQMAAADSVKDVFDALRELVTNADDSYHRMGKPGGRIVIEAERHKATPSLLRVKDRAEGMTLEEMEQRIRRVGDRTSDAGDRGFFARGARDCSVLGDMTFEAIKSGRYRKCEFTRNWEFIPWETGSKKHRSPVASDADKQRLGVRQTGMTVTLETKSLPQIGTIRERLQLFWPLRDILDETSGSQVFITDGTQTSMVRESVCYRMPEAELVVDEEYTVPGYDGARARLRIWRAPEPLVDISDRFRRTGILVKAARAIHECGYLGAHELENDPLAHRYFGRLECAYIDTLCDEWDQLREEGADQSQSNPEFIIDPQRQRGLSRSHPFTKALYKHPTETLRKLVAEDRRAQAPSPEVIGGEALQRRLQQLAKAAERFIEDEAEAEDLVTEDDDVQDDVFKTGVLLWPSFVNVPLDGERKLTLYASTRLDVSEGTSFTIRSDSQAVEPLAPMVQLRKAKRRNDFLVATVVLRGSALAEGVLITATAPDLPAGEALATVLPDTPTDHEFSDQLEFEHKAYKIREGKSKTLRLYAQYPELVTGEAPATVVSSSPEDIVVRGKTRLTPVEGTNYAAGDVVVEARRQLAGQVTLTATANDVECRARIRVVQEEAHGVPLKIEVKDKPLYGFRAQWADAEGKPNLLEISSRHLSVKRYLGAAPEYAGQDTPMCRLLIAEIVAEAVCRRTLARQAANRRWEFDWARSQDTEAIADSVIVHFNRLMEQFLPVAHAAMVTDAEVRHHLEANASPEGSEPAPRMF